MEKGRNREVVTRFAPSPTGFMHVGGIRTALYAYLFAKKNNGTFVLRIEDTDKAREVDGSIDHILESIDWLGITPDEGPKQGGDFGPYKQSDRLDLYKKYALHLIEKGYAYPDPFTQDEVELLRQKAEAEKKPFLYREYRKESIEAWDGKKPLRFKVPEVKEYHWNDVVFGDLSAGPEALDDFILLKADGYPTYNFAHIVDDIEMGVTHVMRGGEFISSVPKFLALYEALGIEPPVFATLPPIMGPDGKKKLSKRDGAKDLLEYKKEGYLPDAFINFLALLGWNPGDDREIFTKEELIEAFSLERIGRSGSGFNEEKLDWVNKEHIKMMSDEKAKAFILERLPADLQNEKLVPLIKERIHKWDEIQELSRAGEFDFVKGAMPYEKDKLGFKNVEMPEIFLHLKKGADIISAIDEEEFTKEKIKQEMMNYADTLPSRGEFLHPVRVALSGKDRSPDPFTMIAIIGKDEAIQRIQKAAS